MHRYFIKAVFGLFCLWGSALHAQAQNPASDLIASLDKITTFKAHFSQRIRDPEGTHISKTQGEVVIKRPGKFYWKSQAPDPILVVADGRFTWTYDIDLAQVTKQSLKMALRNSPASLLAGDPKLLTSDFNISYSEKCKGKHSCFLLKPKQKDSTFANINIIFSQGKLIEINMHDSLGQEVKTNFSNVHINENINYRLFSFSPPKGVDIILSGS